jgi:hypothetical protein
MILFNLRRNTYEKKLPQYAYAPTGALRLVSDRSHASAFPLRVSGTADLRIEL